MICSFVELRETVIVRKALRFIDRLPSYTLITSAWFCEFLGFHVGERESLAFTNNVEVENLRKQISQLQLIVNLFNLFK